MEFYDEFDLENRMIETVEKQAKLLKINESIVIESQPCKIIYLKIKQSNKAGKPVLLITGESYWNGKTYNNTIDIVDSTVTSPVLIKNEYFLISVDRDNYVTLMDLKGNSRSDLKLCDETSKDRKINQILKSVNFKKCDVLVSVLSVLGYDKIVDFKVIDK